MTEKPKSKIVVTPEQIEDLASIMKKYELETLEVKDIRLTRESKQIKDTELAEERRKDEAVNRLGKSREL